MQQLSFFKLVSIHSLALFTTRVSLIHSQQSASVENVYFCFSKAEMNGLTAKAKKLVSICQTHSFFNLLIEN